MLLWSMIVLEVMHDAPLLGDGGCTSFSASYSDCPLASVRVHARTDRTHTCTRCKSDVRTRGSLKCGSLRSMCGVCDVLEPSRSTVVECGGLVWRLEFVSALTRLQVCRFTALCIRFSREPWYVTCTRSAMYMSLLCFSLCTLPFHWLQPRPTLCHGCESPHPRAKRSRAHFPRYFRVSRCF